MANQPLSSAPVRRLPAWVTVLPFLAVAATCRDFRDAQVTDSRGGSDSHDGGDQNVGGDSNGGTDFGGSGFGAAGGSGEPGSGGSVAGGSSGGAGEPGDGVGGNGNGGREDDGGNAGREDPGGQGGAPAGTGGGGFAGATGGGGLAGAGGGSQGGGGGGGVCANDETIFPECITNPAGQFPPVSLERAVGIGVAGQELVGGAYHLFASKASEHTIAVSWGRIPSGFVEWACFDAIPHPARVASMELSNGHPEVFVTTQCGELFVRRLVEPLGWSGWSTFRRPRDDDSFVTDVALSISRDRRTHVYVADRGRVYVRHRASSAPYAGFGEWREIGGTDYEVVASGLRADGRQQVFALDSHGGAWTAVQISDEIGASFGEWAGFGSESVRTMVDIEAVYGTANLEVYGVDEDGELWTRNEDGLGGVTEWQEWPGPPPSEGLVALAAAAVPNGSVLAVGIGESGVVYRATRVSGSWSTWTLHPN